jgi:AraC-like DNA-binding protein
MGFARASRFLQQIIKHAQTATVSDLRKADLVSGSRSLVALEKEVARLHEALRRPLPQGNVGLRSGGPKSRGEDVLRALLERIHLNYAKPIRLQCLARELGMNTTYVSALFSRSLGVPFKTYLTELRVQKAEELLGDFARTASEVAYATGYTSAERFRCAFKKTTGLSPRAWRETMQAKAVAAEGG